MKLMREALIGCVDIDCPMCEAIAGKACGRRINKLGHGHWENVPIVCAQRVGEYRRMLIDKERENKRKTNE